MQHGPIYFGTSELHRMGVFASRDIAVGEIIEICPVLVFPEEELEHLDQTIMYDYYFNWTEREYAVCLGYGSLYNHSYQPNAEYDMDFDQQTIDFFCIKPIPAGTEILVNYNGYPEVQTTVWFETDQKVRRHKGGPQPEGKR
jgi:uncharacterized protein